MLGVQNVGRMWGEGPGHQPAGVWPGRNSIPTYQPEEVKQGSRSPECGRGETVYISDGGDWTRKPIEPRRSVVGSKWVKYLRNMTSSYNQTLTRA